MLLSGKNALIYGGAGAIGSTMARAFAGEGARVHLAGRTQATLDAVADDIRSSGGLAETARVDALDEAAVDAHVEDVAGRFGSVDVSFNLISVNDVQGTPLVEMSLHDYEMPIVLALRSTFITTRAAARQMIGQKSGVILMFGGDGGRDPIRHYSIGGFQVALNAVFTASDLVPASLVPHSTSPAARWPTDPGAVRRAGGRSPWANHAESGRPPSQIRRGPPERRRSGQAGR